MRRLLFVSWLFPSLLLAGLSPVEQREVDDRMTAFLTNAADPSLMDAHPPKFSLGRGKFVHTHLFLEKNEAFRRYQCEHFDRKHFPGITCGGPQSSDAAIEKNDRVGDLADSWMDREEIVRDMESVPVTGKIKKDLWSGDYWQGRWGFTSYRPSSGVEYKTYKEAIESYAQPKVWAAAVTGLTHALLAAEIVKWSPAEKYDLTVQDEDFSLTNEQKNEGKSDVNLDPTGNLPDWIGLCDGWAAAAILVPAPTKTVDTIAPGGATVTWYPDDIRAMASLAWARGDFAGNFISGRCEEKDPKKYPNGRVSSQDCFDTNPGTFHLALASLVGKKGLPFIMDVSLDKEVWNQPVVSYELKFVNPLDPKQSGTDWTKYAVPYDDVFKAKDRFQKPLTRGTRKNHGRDYDDSKIEKIVAVEATVVYLDDADPSWAPVSQPNAFNRVTYLYDLELVQKRGKWVPTGGEWFENDHPDFLWLPRHGQVASSGDDDTSLEFTPGKKPSHRVTRVAQKASEGGFPLCAVLKGLVESSNAAGEKYECNITAR